MCSACFEKYTKPECPHYQQFVFHDKLNKPEPKDQPKIITQIILVQKTQ